jgi:hypothetical protein
MTLPSGAAEVAHPGQELQAAHERWERLPGWQQGGIIALAALEVVCTTKAVVDLYRRPRAAVRGPKTLWFLGFAVQPFGPIAYLALGRRRG